MKKTLISLIVLIPVFCSAQYKYTMQIESGVSNSKHPIVFGFKSGAKYVGGKVEPYAMFGTLFNPLTLKKENVYAIAIIGAKFSFIEAEVGYAKVLNLITQDRHIQDSGDTLYIYKGATMPTFNAMYYSIKCIIYDGVYIGATKMRDNYFATIGIHFTINKK